MEGVLGLPVPPSSPSLGLPCQGLSLHPINPCASQAPRAGIALLPCTHWWQHLVLTQRRPGSQPPSPASPTHCVTLNMLSSFSKLCCPHLSEGDGSVVVKTKAGRHVRSLPSIRLAHSICPIRGLFPDGLNIALRKSQTS